MPHEVSGQQGDAPLGARERLGAEDLVAELREPRERGVFQVVLGDGSGHGGPPTIASLAKTSRVIGG